MAIGNYYSRISKNRVARFVINLLGVVDLHTHIRLKPVVGFFKEYFKSSIANNTTIRILELGCGVGINAFEIHNIAKKTNVDFDYIGVDLSLPAIETANQVLQSFQHMKPKISFYQEDAGRFLEKYLGPPFDVVLLIDIIEHIRNPQKLICSLVPFLKDNGIFVVSVPTPQYSKIFGRDFTSKIGHLVDGYSLLQLEKLFKNLNCHRTISKYNTGLFSTIGCWLYYNKLSFSNKYFNFLKWVALYPFKFLDFYNNPQVSCSLFVVYKRKNNEK